MGLIASYYIQKEPFPLKPCCVYTSCITDSVCQTMALSMPDQTKYRELRKNWLYNN